MKELHGPKSLGLREVALTAAAIGAVAVGAFAIGALAIGKLAVRYLSVEDAKLKSLEIEDLTVSRLRAGEVIVRDSLKLPGTSVGCKISPKTHRKDQSCSGPGCSGAGARLSEAI